MTEVAGKLISISNATGLSTGAVERAAIQLFRAQQLLAEDYDGWWKDYETDENWQTLLIESERDRYREVAAEFMIMAGLS